MKIITFTKNNQFQALLQYGDPVNAQQAKLVSLGFFESNNFQWQIYIHTHIYVTNIINIIILHINIMSVTNTDIT